MMMRNLGITLLVLVLYLKHGLGDNIADAKWSCDCGCDCGASSQFADSPPLELQSLVHPQQYSACLCAAGPCSCSCNCGPRPPPEDRKTPELPSPSSPNPPKEEQPEKPPSPIPPKEEQPEKPPSPEPPKQEQPKNPPSPKPPKQEQPGNDPQCQVEGFLPILLPFTHGQYRDCWCSLSYSYNCDLQIWNSLAKKCVKIDANCCSVYCQLPKNCRRSMFGHSSRSFDYAVRQYCYRFG